jgi:hypothetical protein
MTWSPDETGIDWDDEDEIICPVTGAYCTGQFCLDYGCSKKVGIYDDYDYL